MSGRAGNLESGVGVGTSRAPGPILTTREAAALLRVDVDTLYAMPVPYFTVGKGRKHPRRRYLREHILEWCVKRARAS